MSKWNTFDDEVLVELHSIHGNEWSKYEIPNKKPWQISARWKNHVDPNYSKVMTNNMKKYVIEWCDERISEGCDLKWNQLAKQVRIYPNTLKNFYYSHKRTRKYYEEFDILCIVANAEYKKLKK